MRFDHFVHPGDPILDLKKLPGEGHSTAGTAGDGSQLSLQLSSI